MAIRHTVIRRTVTAMVRIIIRTMGGTIPGLGTATVGMDIRTIGNQRIETKLTKRAQTVLDLFSQIQFLAVKTQAVSSKCRGNSDRFHYFFDVLFRAVLDLLEFLVLAEFSKTSFNHLEEFVDILHKPCEFSTNLSRIQFRSGLRIGLPLKRLCERCEARALGALRQANHGVAGLSP